MRHVHICDGAVAAATFHTIRPCSGFKDIMNNRKLV